MNLHTLPQPGCVENSAWKNSQAGSNEKRYFRYRKYKLLSELSRGPEGREAIAGCVQRVRRPAAGGFQRPNVGCSEP